MSTVPLFLSQSQAYLAQFPSVEPRLRCSTPRVEALGFASVLGLFAMAVLVALTGG